MFKKWGAALLSAAMFTAAMPVAGIASAADEDLTGNTKLTADEIKLGKVINTTLTKSENDWYVFTLSEPSKVNIVFGSGDSFNNYGSDFSLYDAGNDDTTLVSGLIGQNLNLVYYLTKGDYYIKIHGCNFDDVNYDMKITSTPSNLNVPGDGSNNAIGEAAEIKLDTDYNAQISQNDNIDYYTFELAKDGRVTFDFSGTLDAVDWALYNNQDDLEKHGTYQKNDAKDSKITKKNSLVLKAGKYTLSVGANEKAPSYGAYTFSLDYLEKYNDTAVNGIIAFGDINKDGLIDASDASLTLAYYAYMSTGGSETDMNAWIEANTEKSK